VADSQQTVVDPELMALMRLEKVVARRAMEIENHFFGPVKNDQSFVP